MRLMRYAVVVTAASLFVFAAGCEQLPWIGRKSTTASASAATTKKAKAEKEPLKPLYDRLGGETAIRSVVDDFVARAAADEKVNFTRKGIAAGREWHATPENVQKLKDRLVQFLCVATGGPQRYEGQDMRTVHKGMKITDAEFDAIAADLKASLDAHKVPSREQNELLDIASSTRGVIVETP
jgi:hemoglobin